MIGICGGVGPAAGILFHQTILQHTESHGIDQGHLNVCHFSRSADITNRQHFLAQLKLKEASSSNGGEDRVDESLENPACGMARTFDMLYKTAQAANAPVVAGIPCITFHADPIWNEFRRLVKWEDGTGQCYTDTRLRCLHLLHETAKFLADVAPTCRRIGIMCTDGTRGARVFNDLFEPLGYEVLEVPDDVQVELHDTIQNPEWGIKNTAMALDPCCITNFHRYARMLINAGADVLILGCSEIPFAFGGATSFEGTLLIDPLVALARALIREVDPSRLKPLYLNGKRHP
ncbi:hypothetical protein Poli38472_009566 [Pythium oligandrum]|uniref:Aspartate racemase n=1 Tax=Pythium oligandrum TaxID=41045 RepID=A0A8K1CFH6_PYTOL|nr:hypothetical protein Poli38472_009566 [Pythium oligandrum]|eukprot:TMW62073.1 hypothetical protein Poli38472_009566 [Pythium oligandrum]